MPRPLRDGAGLAAWLASLSPGARVLLPIEVRIDLGLQGGRVVCDPALEVGLDDTPLAVGLADRYGEGRHRLWLECSWGQPIPLDGRQGEGPTVTVHRVNGPVLQAPDGATRP